MSVELTPGTAWVQVTSHRARSRLKRAIPNLGASHGVWPDKGGWPTGEFYMVPTEHLRDIRNIPGVKIRTHAPRGEIFRRWK